MVFRRAGRMAALAAVVIVGMAALPAARATGTSSAPGFTLQDLKGAKVSVDYGASKLTLVNFWAVWCGPCREEMPQIAKLVEKYGKQRVAAFGIAVESGEADDVKDFLDQSAEDGDLRVNYPILMGTNDTLKRFGGVQAVPTTFLIDPAGKIVKRFVGMTPGFTAKLENEIRKALEPEPPPSGDHGKP